MTKAEEILEKHLVEYDTKSYIEEDRKLKQCYINAINEALTTPVVSGSAMYKATFSFKKSSPRGGTPYWTREIVPLEAKNETELKEKIATYQEDDQDGYHEHIKLVNITLISN